ncbi:Variant surface glycoprotein [Trypanosoma congolense IL3000]|uniref:Variant surface glycoprotein n=1 Tax=Trypanosoma congolense (strain IL3000) TaxID=1068625 RepID=F9W6U6_TRYCI|nr:Variant surface glycoprotein [Trypanosoma congolense IL3000]
MVGMMLKYWMVIFFEVIVVGFADVGSTNHNGDAHRALCDVLKAAVSELEDVKDSESPMKDALRKTIFGDISAAQTASRLEMPGEYTKPEKNDKENTRKMWCGTCGSGAQKHYPGESATHDLLCLCTPGQHGWPMKSFHGETICGQSHHTLGNGVSNKWWYTAWSDHDQEREHLNKTWSDIVVTCLHTDDRIDLDTALRTFMETITKNKEHRLGEGGFDCDGKTGVGVCVFYPPGCTRKTWWHELEKAIPKHKEWEAKQKSATEKEMKLSSSQGRQTAQQKNTQSRQPTPTSVSQSPQAEESDGPPRAEQVISNINATIEEDSSTIIYPFWLLLVFLYN